MHISIKRSLWWFSLLLLATKAHAQIELLFDTDEPYKMLIGFNGYVQTPKLVSSAVISKIKEGEHTLNVIAIGGDTLVFNKTINLFAKEKQHYLLTRDFKGKLQLQYRGIVERYPLNVPIIQQQQLLAWQEFKNTQINGNKLKAENIVVTETEKPTTAATTMPIPSEIDIAILKVKKDSLNGIVALEPNLETKPPLAVHAEIKVNAFSKVTAEIKQSESEFDKLLLLQSFIKNNSITQAQASELSQFLRFDDSRLQFLLEVKNKLTSEQALALADSFQFEYTKKTYLKALIK